MKKPACFSAEVRSTGVSIGQRLPFRRILHAARQIDVQREDDRPGRRLTQPTHQPICGSTRACHPVFALRIQSRLGLDDHDILTDADARPLNGSLRYSFRRKSTVRLLNPRAPSASEAIDDLRTGRVAILNPSQILLFAHSPISRATADTPIRRGLMDERRV